MHGFKRAVKANKSSKPVQHKLDEFLLVYCVSPRATTDQSPWQLMFGHKAWTKLNLLKPNVRRTVNCKRLVMKTNLIDLFMRDNKCWSRMTSHGGNEYWEKLPFKQGLCHTEFVQTIQSEDGMAINCIWDLVSTVTQDLKPKLSVRKLQILHLQRTPLIKLRMAHRTK